MVYGVDKLMLKLFRSFSSNSNTVRKIRLDDFSLPRLLRSFPQVHSLISPTFRGFCCTRKPPNFRALGDTSCQNRAWKRLPCFKSFCVQSPQKVTKMSEANEKEFKIEFKADVRGMKVLEREAFQQIIHVPTLEMPAKKLRFFMNSVTLKAKLLKRPSLPSVVESPGEDADLIKLIRFSPGKVTSLADFNDEEITLLKNCDVDLDTWKSEELQLEYKNFTYKEILAAVIPEDCGAVAGFSIIGHIIHLNLREEQLPYKEIIGQVLLDKLKQVKSVVYKTDSIDNTYRTFKMEVVAGDDSLITTCKEHGHAFEMDFSKVYWNPRLSTEHKRVVDLLKEGDKVYDMFAGIGPFAVPAARKKCLVHANDLNPESYKWLEHNMVKNKVKVPYHTYNMDGRDFAQQVIKEDLLKLYRTETDVDNCFRIHIVMNLPALALEFLPVFVGLLEGEEVEDSRFIAPTVYCYSFSKDDDPVQDTRQSVQSMLGCMPTDLQVSSVRDVAPHKEMMCSTFSLDRTILFSSTKESIAGEPEETPAKKPKLDTASS